MNTLLIKMLVLQYLIISLVSLYEKNTAMAIYWIGAVILNIGVLMLGKQ